MAPTSLSETLRQDHKRGNQAFDELAQAQKEEERLQKVFDLQNTVIPQIRAEGKEVYSRLEGAAGGFDVTKAGRDLQQIEDELMELARRPVDKPEFEDQLEKARGVWEAHIQQEESTLLDQLESALGADAANVVERYSEERERHTRSGEETGRNWMV